MPRLVRALAAVLPVAVVLLAAPAAHAENVVNYTFHVPASVETNPCFPADVVNLSGDIHVVISTTASGGGGYRVFNHLNSALSGASITTGTRYVNLEDHDDSWYAGPLPAVHTTTYSFNLVSQSGTPDYVLRMTMHTTVTPNGIPTAVVDGYRMDCRG